MCGEELRFKSMKVMAHTLAPPSAWGAQSEESSQLMTVLVGGHCSAGLHSPVAVCAARSTVRQQTSPVLPQRMPLSPQRTLATVGSSETIALCASVHETSTQVCLSSQLTLT